MLNQEIDMEARLEDFALTPEQADTVTLLDRLFGHAIASRYVDFCRLATSATELSVTRPLAAHALRELESMIRSSLEVPMDAKVAPQLDQREGDVKKALEALGYESAAVQRVLKALPPRMTHATQIKLIAERLGLAPDGDVAHAWIKLCDSFGRAHERSFHRSLSVDDAFRQSFQEPFELVVRSIVTGLQKRYSALIERVEQIAAMKDHGGAVRLYEREIPGALPLQWHFFQIIESPQWLPHLLARGLASEPLPAIDGAGSQQFREWPVAHYLLKLAKSEDPGAHRAVAEAVRGVAPSKHPDVRHQGLQVIAALPPAMGAELVDVAIGWLDPDAPSFYLDAPDELLKRISEAGHAAAAIRLAGAIFQVIDRGGTVASLHPEAMYEHHLPGAVQTLAMVDGFAALNLFSTLLVKAETVANHFGDPTHSDYTYMTPHPLIDSQMATYGIVEGLIIAVRDVALALCARDPANVERAVKALLEFKAKIFTRIALHVLSKYADAAPVLSTAMLMDGALVGESWCEEDYSDLARARFPTMTLEQQEQVFRIVDAMPDHYRASWIERFEAQEKRPPNAEELRNFDRYVVRDALWKWREALPEARRRAIENIAEELGDPDAWRHRLFPEEVSPLSGAELSTQAVPKVVAFLQAWQPQQEPARQTIAALGQQLRSAVEQGPERFAGAADQFMSLRPIYIRRVLEGLESKARNGEVFDWPPVLTLIASTIRRLSNPGNTFPAAEGDDADWLWTCSAAASLLKSSLRQGRKGAPHAHAAAILAIMRRLFRDAPRTPQAEDFEKSFSRHPYFSAEQSLWGSAIELCVLFVFWASKHEESAVSQNPRAALESVPEIRGMLEEALADLSPAGRIPRAIVGRYLNWLLYFAQEWVEAHASGIFPSGSEALRRAAWLGHLLSDNGPAKAIARQLAPLFVDEIDRLAGETEKRDQDHRDNRLGDYIIILFLVDKASDELMQAFWQRAPERARLHAMSFLGRELSLPPDKLEARFRARGLHYWESRLAAAAVAGNPDWYRAELGAISQWCGRDNIDVAWLLEQLLQMLGSGFAPGSGYTVVEWLGKLAPSYPDKTVAVLSALLSSPRIDHWTYTTRRDSIRTILETGLTGGRKDTADRVSETVSFLSTVGETGYLDLVRPP
jgi:hypothetical protein